MNAPTCRHDGCVQDEVLDGNHNGIQCTPTAHNQLHALDRVVLLNQGQEVAHHLLHVSNHTSSWTRIMQDDSIARSRRGEGVGVGSDVPRGRTGSLACHEHGRSCPGQWPRRPPTPPGNWATSRGRVRSNATNHAYRTSQTPSIVHTKRHLRAIIHALAKAQAPSQSLVSTPTPQGPNKLHFNRSGYYISAATKGSPAPHRMFSSQYDKLPRARRDILNRFPSAKCTWRTGGRRAGEKPT